jgi:hypothetical protein
MVLVDVQLEYKVSFVGAKMQCAEVTSEMQEESKTAQIVKRKAAKRQEPV